MQEAPPVYPSSAMPPSATAASHACTRDLYELLSQLSDIKCLALALASGRLGGAGEHEGSSMEGSTLSPAPITPGRQAYVDGAASFAAATAATAWHGADAGFHGTQGSPPPSPNDAWAHGLGVQSGSGVDLVSAAAADAGSTAVAGADVAGLGAEAGTTSSPAGAYSSSVASPAPRSPVGGIVVSQLIHGVDQASNLGERALRLASDELGCLMLQLSDVVQDREIWVQRFLAMRELQYSCRLCEQALRLDAAYAVPAAAVGASLPPALGPALARAN
eukprot:TRINITY_DN20780_c0_g2_i2.p1 TRINITY_DN20780_c0_g2~~TRINITY_DN20780_c0_g2_i2.p1  ORF type:complete len:276 (-),score=54.58 TRINITY_DN20780_c0_g2_i2:123-950(-)